MIKRRFNKKAIEPIIATVLLVVVAIALFFLVYLWIRSFQQEALLKFNAPIETACSQVDFSVYISENQIQIANTGSVPIHRIEIYEVNSSGTKKIGSIDEDLLASSDIITSISTSGGCEKIKFLPFLLGSTKSGKEKEQACDKSAKFYAC